MKEFYRTVAGRRFFDSELPELVRTLKDIANEMKVANDLKRREMKITEKLRIKQFKRDSENE